MGDDLPYFLCLIMIISLADYDLNVAAYFSLNLIVIGLDYAAAVIL